MKIALLVATNKYHSTAHFAQSLAKAFIGLKVEAKLFPLIQGKERELLSKMASFGPNLSCSFSDITFGEEPFGAVSRVPHLSLLLDPAIYSLHQLSTPFSQVSCVDEEDVVFLRSLGFSNVFFLPHGVDPDLQTFSKSNRPYDIVMLGSCIDYLSVEKAWKEKYSSQTNSLLHRISERVLSSEGTSILRALVDEKVKEEDFARYHDEVDRYTRGKDRIELVRSLEGLNVFVWGGKSGRRGWRDYVGNQRGCTIHRSISFSKAIEVMRQSKLVLNSSPRFKQGSHERILSGILSGALVMSGENDYIRTNFPSLPTYPYGDYENAREKVISSLQDANEEKQVLLTKSVLKDHTWEKRAQSILLNRGEKKG